MYLHRLVYYSENRIRQLGLPLAKELKAILAASQRNNPPAGLTGALVFHDQYFVGILEGERRRVSAMLLRIAGDKRPHNLTILAAGAIEERQFDDWTSIYAGHSDTVDRLYLHWGLTQGLDPARMSGEAMLGLVRAMSKLDPHTLAQPPRPPEPMEIIKVTPQFAGITG